VDNGGVILKKDNLKIFLKGKRKLLIIIISTVLILALGSTALGLFINVGIDVDISSIEKVGTDIVIVPSANGEPLSLYKPDGNDGISSEPFKILSFTDTHFDTYRKKGKYSMEYMVANIQREKPDLVVFVGDIITSSSNKKRVLQFCEVMEKLEVYWVTVLGNHEGDNFRSISREEFIEIYASYPHCLIDAEKKYTSNNEEVWGNGNTQINVLTEGGVVSQSLFFIDSGNRVSKEDAKALNIDKESYDFVKESQIRWYEERVEALPLGTKSMIFVHIPLPEYQEAVDDAVNNPDGTFDYAAISAEGTNVLFGKSNEGVSSSDHNSGLFDSIVSKGSTQAVICGHDHVNNYRILYKNVLLCYNRSSGYSSYNIVTKGMSDKLEQGASIYSINQDGTLSFGDIINRDYFDDSEVLKLY